MTLRLLSLLFGARPPRERDEAMASMQLYSTRREVTAVPQTKSARDGGTRPGA